VYIINFLRSNGSTFGMTKTRKKTQKSVARQVKSARKCRKNCGLTRMIF